MLVNSNQKRGTASFLLEVIDYVHYLQERVEKYEDSYQGWSSEPTKLKVEGYLVTVLGSGLDEWLNCEAELKWFQPQFYGKEKPEPAPQGCEPTQNFVLQPVVAAASIGSGKANGARARWTTLLVLGEQSFIEDMDGGAAYNPRMVKEVFRDFKGRRAGMIKAFTTDVEEFYQQCDPEREYISLYEFHSTRGEANLPAEEVPPKPPEPAPGTAKKQVRYFEGIQPKDEDEEGLEEEEEDDDDDEEHGDACCGACEENYAADEFWICSEKWFHGKCVKITPAKAEHIQGVILR